MRLDWFRRLTVLAVLLGVAVGCAPSMSVEEAKRVTTRFQGRAFVAPPPTIADITTVLDQEQPADAQALARSLARLDEPPPRTRDHAALADFYSRRGLLALQHGRVRQAVEDQRRAVEHGRQGRLELHTLLFYLGAAESWYGSNARTVAAFREAAAAVPADRTGVFTPWVVLALAYANQGDLAAAEEALHEARRRAARSPDDFGLLRAEALYAEARGRLGDAERYFRAAVANIPDQAGDRTVITPERLRAGLVPVRVKQGRLLEAESEARAALSGALRRGGKLTITTAYCLEVLTAAIAEQGRALDAERLARALLDVYRRMETTEESFYVANARALLAGSLVAQGRWADALAEFGALRAALAPNPVLYEGRFAGNPDEAIALIQVGRAAEAARMLEAQAARRRASMGESHPQTAELVGLLGVAHAALGDRARALAALRAALPPLLAAAQDPGVDAASSRPARDQRLAFLLDRYVALLVDVRGTDLERAAGLDAVAEAFRLADVARMRGVQRALDAAAARASAKTPALADLVRREQDTRQQGAALQGALVNLLSQPGASARAADTLRRDIEELTRARQALRDQIGREFPAYADLVSPRPATVEQARARLRAGEALVATLVSADRTLVWAVPPAGPVAFATAPVGEAALRDAVGALRRGVEPQGDTVGDIPAFDVARAHELYRALLEPVRAGWEGASSLLVVAHGPLGHLPFAALPTRPVVASADAAPLFSGYRGIPWLVRTHAVTMLPSVTALGTLRGFPPGAPDRRPLVAFGDPAFGSEPATQAVVTAGPALVVRGLPLRRRSAPRAPGTLGPTQLAPLPETAIEVRELALALQADVARDVFTGPAASETRVRSMNLAGFRVVAFATHGLVPGELPGLTQPALALSRPSTPGDADDGLLTMEEILSLRLDADWVVLSGCNTAAGAGAGAEAISGLGRAFFYAGARAVLVSNWPVETQSARMLTTELFRRQAAAPALTRARALQEAMLWLLDGPGFTDAASGRPAYVYAHPLFWAPFTLVGDGGADAGR